MEDYASSTDSPWFSYSGIVRIVIGEGVTGIGSYAFYGLKEVQQVSLPDSVSRIGACAFYDCDSLVHVDIPANVTVIEAYSFAFCSALEEICMPDGITEIKDGAFSWCPVLTDLDLPASLREIGEDAFHGCGALTCITIPDSVTWIGEEAFSGCKNLEHVVLSSGLTSIEYGVFQDCKALQQVVIPDHVQSIGQYAFSNCQSLKRIQIPAEVTVIGNWAFRGCTGLEEIHFLGDAPFIDSYAFLDVTATGFYPCENETWTQELLLHYGGHITWISDCGSDKAGNPFLDVPEGSFFLDPVLWAVEKGITTGADQTHFNPTGDCLRAQVVTFLWRAEGCPEPVNTGNPFSDVSESDWYYEAVLWAVEKDITNGTSGTSFSPMDKCSRAQIVTFLYRFAGEPEVSVPTQPFTDVNGAQYYFVPMLWAVENGITTGMTDTSFGPELICNRAQVVTFLYRYYCG